MRSQLVKELTALEIEVDSKGHISPFSAELIADIVDKINLSEVQRRTYNRRKDAKKIK